jgi:hypothetical protein
VPDLPRFRYEPYGSTDSTPNIVVDGSANAATVLTLSHWPGAPTPERLKRDLSAEIAFAYLDAPCHHAPADVVTNNHFDQDGLVSVLALTEPELALAHRELLVDVAAAGDFGTYRERRAARASMVIAGWTDDGYAASLPRLLDLARDPEPYRSAWEAEDANLSASEAAVADGRITIEERPDLDLAIVTIGAGAGNSGGHRFAHETFAGVHPMAINNATDRFRLLIVDGRSYRFVDRYETWVQYRSRPTLPRVDMRPLATRLTDVDSIAWTADGPGALTPELRHAADSRLTASNVLELLVEHLGGEPSTPISGRGAAAPTAQPEPGR